MDLQNHTPFPAGLFRTRLADDRLAASVLTRVTYRIANATLVPSSEQPWIVSAAPWASDYGPMDSDEVFYKGGVDLFVFGHARPKSGREENRMEVRLEVGSFRRRLAVFGDRVWEKKGKALVPSVPQPFRSMPLTLDRAYGGKDTWDGLEVPFSDNPAGKGFYLEEANAVGQALPNIEDPDHLSQRWDDRLDPMGVTPCAMDQGGRLRHGLGVDEQGQFSALRPVLFNAAFPRMIAPRVEPGELLRLDGVLPSGTLFFYLPRHGLSIRLQFGDEMIERVPAIDQIGIEVDKGRVFIAYRYPFRYVVYPMQKRSCELLFKEPPPQRTNGVKK